MLELLNFFDEQATGGSSDGTAGSGLPSWVIWVLMGVLVVGMIVWMVLSQRKQKKRSSDMLARLAIGSIVTTIGGIVGEVVQLDDKHIWLLTGTGDNKTTMQFVRQAIHSIDPAPGTPEAEAQAQAEKAKEDEVDEIK